jgi:RNA-directed DNA polymerase
VIPPLVSFPDLDTFAATLREQYRRHGMDGGRIEVELVRARELHHAGLPPLVSIRAMSLLLGISPRLIPAMIANPLRYYRAFSLPKKSGGTRNIVAPRVFLKTIQHYILQNVLSRMPDSECSYGFIKGRGAYMNARRHLSRSFVLNLDIQNFFPSIRDTHIREIFRNLGFSIEMSQVLAAICCYQGRLPQGAPTSPKLSNVFFSSLDFRLQEIALANAAIYTRYADDLTFSFGICPHPTFTDQVRDALATKGFRVNERKTRLQGPAEARYVTGFVTNVEVQPDRETRRLLRAKFHNLSQKTTVDLEELNTSQGWASYVYNYNPQIGSSYLQVVSEARARINPTSAPPSQ